MKEGTYLDGKENVIGKYFKSKDEHGEEQFKDMSSHTKKDNKGSYVDKVFTCQTNAVGDRLCKVRTCQYRKPEIGDKLSPSFEGTLPDNKFASFDIVIC